MHDFASINNAKDVFSLDNKNHNAFDFASGTLGGSDNTVDEGFYSYLDLSVHDANRDDRVSGHILDRSSSANGQRALRRWCARGLDPSRPLQQGSLFGDTGRCCASHVSTGTFRGGCSFSRRSDHELEPISTLTLTRKSCNGRRWVSGSRGRDYSPGSVNCDYAEGDYQVDNTMSCIVETEGLAPSEPSVRCHRGASKCDAVGLYPEASKCLSTSAWVPSLWRTVTLQHPREQYGVGIDPLVIQRLDSSSGSSRASQRQDSRCEQSISSSSIPPAQFFLHPNPCKGVSHEQTVMDLTINLFNRERWNAKPRMRNALQFTNRIKPLGEVLCLSGGASSDSDEPPSKRWRPSLPSVAHPVPSDASGVSIVDDEVFPLNQYSLIIRGLPPTRSAPYHTQTTSSSAVFASAAPVAVHDSHFVSRRWRPTLQSSNAIESTPQIHQYASNRKGVRRSAADGPIAVVGSDVDGCDIQASDDVIVIGDGDDDDGGDNPLGVMSCGGGMGGGDADSGQTSRDAFANSGFVPA